VSIASDSTATGERVWSAATARVDPRCAEAVQSRSTLRNVGAPSKLAGPAAAAHVRYDLAGFHAETGAAQVRPAELNVEPKRRMAQRGVHMGGMHRSCVCSAGHAKKKARNMSCGPFGFWLPDLGSNQGPTD
jgi:hypothetical protein